MFKKVIIHIKTWTKIALTVTIGLIIIGLALYILYKPTYSVTLRGEFIGYTDDKRSLQETINQYTKTGDYKNIAFVDENGMADGRKPENTSLSAKINGTTVKVNVYVTE